MASIYGFGSFGLSRAFSGEPDYLDTIERLRNLAGNEDLPGHLVDGQPFIDDPNNPNDKGDVFRQWAETVDNDLPFLVDRRDVRNEETQGLVGMRLGGEEGDHYGVNFMAGGFDRKSSVVKTDIRHFQGFLENDLLDPAQLPDLISNGELADADIHAEIEQDISRDKAWFADLDFRFGEHFQLGAYFTDWRSRTQQRRDWLDRSFGFEGGGNAPSEMLISGGHSFVTSEQRRKTQGYYLGLYDLFKHFSAQAVYEDNTSRSILPYGEQHSFEGSIGAFDVNPNRQNHDILLPREDAVKEKGSRKALSLFYDLLSSDNGFVRSRLGYDSTLSASRLGVDMYFGGGKVHFYGTADALLDGKDEDGNGDNDFDWSAALGFLSADGLLGRHLALFTNDDLVWSAQVLFTSKNQGDTVRRYYSDKSFITGGGLDNNIKAAKEAERDRRFAHEDLQSEGGWFVGGGIHSHRGYGMQLGYTSSSGKGFRWDTRFRPNGFGEPFKDGIERDVLTSNFLGQISLGDKFTLYGGAGADYRRVPGQSAAMDVYPVVGFQGHLG